MTRTTAEFRHNFMGFRCFRVFIQGTEYSVCRSTGKIDAAYTDTVSWLTGDRKAAFARDIAHSRGRETWTYNLSKEGVRHLLLRWRKTCSREGQTEVIPIEG